MSFTSTQTKTNAFPGLKDLSGKIGTIRLIGAGPDPESFSSSTLSSGSDSTDSSSTLTSGSLKQFTPEEFDKGIDFQSFTEQEQDDFLTHLFTTGKTHLSYSDYMENDAVGIDTITRGLLDLVADNPDKFDMYPGGLITEEDGSTLHKITLRFLRHAQAESLSIHTVDSSLTSSGWHNLGVDMHDAHLTPEGKEQAISMGKQYKAALDLGLMSKSDIDFLSPLFRCEQTLDPISSDRPRIISPLYQENPHRGRGGKADGASCVDQSRKFGAPVWHGSGNFMNESEEDKRTHMRNRAWEAMTLPINTGVELSRITGKNDSTFLISAHANINKVIEEYLYQIAGEDPIDPGFYNTHIKSATICVRKHLDGRTTIEKQDNGKKVTFNGELLPDFAKRYRAIQSQSGWSAKQHALARAAKSAWSASRSESSGMPTKVKEVLARGLAQYLEERRQKAQADTLAESNFTRLGRTLGTDTSVSAY